MSDKDYSYEWKYVLSETGDLQTLPPPPAQCVRIGLRTGIMTLRDAIQKHAEWVDANEAFTYAQSDEDLDEALRVCRKLSVAPRVRSMSQVPIALRHFKFVDMSEVFCDMLSGRAPINVAQLRDLHQKNSGRLNLGIRFSTYKMSRNFNIRNIDTAALHYVLRLLRVFYKVDTRNDVRLIGSVGAWTVRDLYAYARIIRWGQCFVQIPWIKPDIAHWVTRRRFLRNAITPDLVTHRGWNPSSLQNRAVDAFRKCNFREYHALRAEIRDCSITPTTNGLLSDMNALMQLDRSDWLFQENPVWVLVQLLNQRIPEATLVKYFAKHDRQIDTLECTEFPGMTMALVKARSDIRVDVFRRGFAPLVVASAPDTSTVTSRISAMHLAYFKGMLPPAFRVMERWDPTPMARHRKKLKQILSGSINKASFLVNADGGPNECETIVCYDGCVRTLLCVQQVLEKIHDWIFQCNQMWTEYYATSRLIAARSWLLYKAARRFGVDAVRGLIKDFVVMEDVVRWKFTDFESVKDYTIAVWLKLSTRSTPDPNLGFFLKHGPTSLRRRIVDAFMQLPLSLSCWNETELEDAVLEFLPRDRVISLAKNVASKEDCVEQGLNLLKRLIRRDRQSQSHVQMY